MTLVDKWRAAGLTDDGRIPARTDCPFRSACPVAIEGECKHAGESHPVPFSCGLARGFAIVQANEEKP